MIDSAHLRFSAFDAIWFNSSDHYTNDYTTVQVTYFFHARLSRRRFSYFRRHVGTDGACSVGTLKDVTAFAVTISRQNRTSRGNELRGNLGTREGRHRHAQQGAGTLGTGDEAGQE